MAYRLELTVAVKDPDKIISISEKAAKAVNKFIDKSSFTVDDVKVSVVASEFDARNGEDESTVVQGFEVTNNDDDDDSW